MQMSRKRFPSSLLSDRRKRDYGYSGGYQRPERSPFWDMLQFERTLNQYLASVPGSEVALRLASELRTMKRA